MKVNWGVITVFVVVFLAVALVVLRALSWGAMPLTERWEVKG
jgi:hypothetical protein